MAEKDLYKPISAYLNNKLNFCGYTNVYVEITADGKISERLKQKFSHPFTVLENAFFPDLIALYTQNGREKSISIEVKDDPITIKDIFQALSYGIILKTDKSFLISPYDIPQKIKFFLEDRPDILKYNRGKQLYIAQIYDNDIADGDWFPRNPY